MATAYAFDSYFVTPEELQEALRKNPLPSTSTSQRIIPLSAASFPPDDARKGIDAFHECRIPSARFFDLDQVVDKETTLPHMLPSARDFASAMSALGIRKEDVLVVYDTYQLGITSAPRTAWTLRVFGHTKVHVLNNFKLWMENGYLTESGEPRNITPSKYPVPELDITKVAGFFDVKAAVLKYKQGAAGSQVLDARPYGRWAGSSPEPRPGLISGHMPGSISVPLPCLLDPKSKAFLPADQLRRVFEEKGVNPALPVIVSCGSGVTAAAIEAAILVSRYIPEDELKVYDGSWLEWAHRVDPSSGLVERFE